MRDLGWTGIYGAKAIYGKTIGFLGYGSVSQLFKLNRLDANAEVVDS